MVEPSLLAPSLKVFPNCEMNPWHQFTVASVTRLKKKLACLPALPMLLPRPSADKSIRLSGTQRLGFSYRVDWLPAGWQGCCGNFCCVCRQHTFQTNQNNCRISHTSLRPHQVQPVHKPTWPVTDQSSLLGWKRQSVRCQWIVAVGWQGGPEWVWRVKHVCVYKGAGRWGIVGKQLTTKMGSYLIVSHSDRAEMCFFVQTAPCFPPKLFLFDWLKLKFLFSMPTGIIIIR